MSLRFGSGWLVIYFLICSCTFICSAPQLRARDCTTFNPFEPLPFSVTPDTRFWVTFSPLQGRAALTVEVTRPRGRPASRCCVGAFQNSQRLEMCGAPRSGQRGWRTDPLPPVANRLEWLCAVFRSDLEFQESLNAACNLQLCPISAHSNRSSLSL